MTKHKITNNNLRQKSWRMRHDLWRKLPSTKFQTRVWKLRFGHWKLFVSCNLVIVLFGIFTTFFISSLSYAEVAIETSVSKSHLSLGEEVLLDISISDADGKVSKPIINSIDGFSYYSQGHSQEISIINGQQSTRSVFTYVLIANAPGKKTIGPFEINIGDQTYKIAGIQVEVTPDKPGAGRSSGPVYTQGPVVAPPSRALPQNGVTNQDIFVKAWLDKDEVFVNEPAMLTYTIYTRLSATYKGFEKEPVTTGFWVEDFPPEKTIRKTEQIFNGSRYVVADVRKMALFPTQVGVFTIDPGTLATTVEVRDREDFDSFFSYNIFGKRSAYPPSFVTQVFEKAIPTQPVSLIVKALPEAGKPSNFNGAVGDYQIESSVDKTEAEEGTPVTYRVRIFGRGNINTVETPALPKMEDFKIYDSSSSAHISKDHLVVEGDKVTETVLVPKKAGAYTIPSLEFSYFDSLSRTYETLRTPTHRLTVNPSTEAESATAMTGGVQPVEKEEVGVLGRDIRFIKKAEDKKAFITKPLYRNSVYWALNLLLLLASVFFLVLSAKRQGDLKDSRGLRLRRSHRAARRRLKATAALLKKGSRNEFYAELSKAIYGYFSDKLNIPAQKVDLDAIEAGLAEESANPVLLADIKTLFDELALGRFASVEKSDEDMKRIYQMADQVITLFEKAKLK